jgi:uroporphyrinogen decarboxylase
MGRLERPPRPAKNDTFLRACLRQATDHTPLWLMRQAGRYLPEYCATRAKAGSFMGLATNVDYATEVTLQPLERYPLDAAILFSDILTVPDAMGLGLSFAQGEGPRFASPVRDEAAVAKLAKCPTWTSCATCSTPSPRSARP